MRNGFVPATVVISKPVIGIVSTKSSIAQIVDEAYFGGTPCTDSYSVSFKDSDCGSYPDNREQEGTITDPSGPEPEWHKDLVAGRSDTCEWCVHGLPSLHLGT